MTIEIWFFPSIIALLVWGVTSFVPKLALRTLSPVHLLIYQYGFFMLTAVVLLALFGQLEFEKTGFILSVLTGIAGALGQLFYLVALRRGPLTYVAMISSLYPLVATLLAFMLLHEPLTARQIGGVILGICAIVLLVVSSDK